MASSTQGGLMGRSVTSSGSQQQQHRSHRPASMMCCNRCRKPFTATLFILSCDCAFCEDCTYDHFVNSTNCPNCKKTLKKEDFMQIMVAEPTANSEAIVKNSMQYLFSKRVPGGKGLSSSDACNRFMKQYDAGYRAGRFLLRQLVADATAKEQLVEAAKKAQDTAKEETMQQKQLLHTMQEQAEQKIGELQSQMSIMSITIQERDAQIVQLHEYYAKNKHNDLPPASSHTHGSGGKRGPSAPPPPQQQFMPADQPMPNRAQRHRQQQPPPPMQQQQQQQQQQQHFMQADQPMPDRTHRHRQQPPMQQQQSYQRRPSVPAAANPHHYAPAAPVQNNMPPRVSLGANSVRPVSVSARNSRLPFTPVQVPPHYASVRTTNSVASELSNGSAEDPRIHDPRNVPHYTFSRGGSTASGGNGNSNKYNSGIARSMSPSNRFQNQNSNKNAYGGSGNNFYPGR